MKIMLENKLTSNGGYIVVGYLTRIVLVKNHQISLLNNKRKFSVMPLQEEAVRVFGKVIQVDVPCKIKIMQYTHINY